MKLFLKKTILILLLFVPTSSWAGEQTKPSYNAKTVEECIHEKECFWHHLLLAVQTSALHKQATKRINVRKWQQPVHFVRHGNSEGVTSNYINGLMSQVIPVFFNEVTDTPPYNYVIIITDSIEEELSGKYKPYFDQIAGKDVTLNAYRIAAKPRNEKCHYLLFQDPNNHLSIYSYYAFIQKDHPDIKKCLKETVYAGFGLQDISHSHIIKTHPDPNSFTKLELLIMYYLNQDFIKSGISYQEFQETFDMAYDGLISELSLAEGNGIR